MRMLEARSETQCVKCRNARLLWLTAGKEPGKSCRARQQQAPESNPESVPARQKHVNSASYQSQLDGTPFARELAGPNLLGSKMPRTWKPAVAAALLLTCLTAPAGATSRIKD